ncbi:hypothetical protein E4U55_000591 [Claviceps digitariae]|nr:hypothetical protein E4U55_000591 [Claviceps digitariae]
MSNEFLVDDAQGFPYNNKLGGPRGPLIDYAAELEKRMPIKQEKLEKAQKSGSRESKLGLINIFAKSRLSRDVQTLTDSTAALQSNASRISLVGAEQSLQSSQQDPSLPTDFSWTPLPVMLEDSDSEQLLSPQRSKTSSTKGRWAPPPSRSGWQPAKGSSSTWSPPPLFKAFPQAVHHVTLPATSLTADAILRMNERRNSLQGKESEDTTSNVMEPDHDGIEKDEEKSKKKTRRNRAASAPTLKWTSKLYILVTSGYLLQYPVGGSYDRLPEKVLRLGPLSAAFATDAIPGRHWVIQVSSVAEMDDAPAAESRSSIFSKLSFRTAERRNATNLLMVFEDAESMEGWLTALRTEIEKQGGKKKLSETGGPKNETAEESPREHVSPRTPIVRDPSRFASSAASGSRSSGCSSISNNSNSNNNSRGVRGRSRGWTLESESRCSETSPRTTSSKAAGSNQSLDDVSITNSIVSQDERNLDSLRETSNRLSFISSGQRTVATSSGSSLDDSPTHDRSADGVLGTPAESTPTTEVKPRLNALEISSRSESVQAMERFPDDGYPPTRSDYRAPTSHRATVMSGEGMVSPVGATATPNFSVPHTSIRRYSCVSRPRSRANTGSPTRIRDGGSPPRRSSRRRGPVAMQSVHRLSVVTDPSVTRSIATEQLHTAPPPRPPPPPPRPTTRPTGDDAQRQRLRSVSRGRASQRGMERLPEVPRVLPDAMTEDVGWNGIPCSPRSPGRHTSTSALRQGASLPSPKSQAALPRMPHIAQLLALNRVPTAEEVEAQSMSFLNMGDGDGDGDGEGDGEPQRPLELESAKRVSKGSVLSSRSSVSYDIHGSTAPSNINSLDSCVTIACGSKSASGQYADVERTPRSSCVQNRRTMSHMALDGPPPAPPPTRALPPIPQKARSRRG